MDMIFFKEKKILEEIESIEAHMDKCNNIHNRRISELQRDINFINDFEIDGIKKKLYNDIEYKLIKLDRDVSYTIITLSVIAGVLICINILLLMH
jgi:hypothetical protein